MRNHIRFKMLVLITALAFCLSACQPTPSKQPVPAKGKLEEKLKVLGIEGKYQVAERAVAEFTNTKGDTTIKINTDVKVPDVTKYPVARVESFLFSEEFKDKMVEYFIGEPKDLYMTVYIWSKEAYQRQINHSKEDLEYNRERGISPQEEQRILRSIAKDEEAMRSAPETDEEKRISVTTDFTYICSEPYEIGDTPRVEVNKDLEDGTTASLRIENYLNSPMAYGYKGGYDLGKYERNPIDSYAEDIQKAQAVAEEFMEQFGIENRVAADVTVYNAIKPDGTLVPCYKFQMKRSVGGVLVEKVEVQNNFTDDPDAYFIVEYSQVYFEESMSISVVESEVVSFSWNNPDRQIETMTENAALLPFDEILDYAKKYIFYRNFTGYDFKCIIGIHEIKLNYMRIRRKDHPNEFLYVPVWDFIGTNTFIGQHSSGHNYCMLTLNAIDGSYIDRRVGY